MNCPRCNSDDLEPFSGDFPTGVKFDMWSETQWEEGLECQQCGLRFEEQESDGGFEAFCQEQSEL